MLNLKFSPQAWNDYLYWQNTDPKTLKRIHELLRDCCRSPYHGIGKPEGLRGNLSGWWSRRITDADRLVYRLDEAGKTLMIAQLRYHY